ncbi:hypothetical protein ACGFI3_33740 [Nonomuraea wenchangensis]|uniref:hypothetical protein n=1 Tax=Nonomuraea wenchangensis TaxID=568860 RepID=UPI00372406D9
MVTPVQVTGLAKTFLVVRAHRGEHDRTLTADRVLRAGFVEATPYVLDQWTVPPRGVDALVHDGGGRPWWLSATWLRAESGEAGRRRLDGPSHAGRQRARLTHADRTPLSAGRRVPTDTLITLYAKKIGE